MDNYKINLTLIGSLFIIKSQEMIFVKNIIVPGEAEKKFMGEPLPIRLKNEIMAFVGSLMGPPNNGRGSFM